MSVTYWGEKFWESKIAKRVFQLRRRDLQILSKMQRVVKIDWELRIGDILTIGGVEIDGDK